MLRRGPAHTKLREDAAGFTLLELLIVLAILAVLLVVVPQATAGLPAMRLRAAAASLGETLRQARNTAVSTGRPVDVAIDARQHSYTAFGQIPVLLPPVVDKIDLKRDAPGAQDANVRFRFFPDGSATGGVITLRHEQRHAAIIVAWLTGRVRVDD